jgi:hypothetical protein
MQVRIASRRVLVTLGAVGGFIGAAFATARAVGGAGVFDAALAEPFSIVLGITSGGLVGFSLWTLLHRSGISRLAMVLVAVNCCAWLLYLVVIPRLPDGDDAINRQRAERDAEEARGWPNGMTMTSHPPSLLAARPLSWASLAEKPLGLMAGPAVAFVERQAVPQRYRQTGPTVVESYWIASIAFLVSTAWRVTVAFLWSSLRSVRSRPKEMLPNPGCT